MTSELSSAGFCESQGVRSVRQMRQLVGLLFHNSVSNSTITSSITRPFSRHCPGSVIAAAAASSTSSSTSSSSSSSSSAAAAKQTSRQSEHCSDNKKFRTYQNSVTSAVSSNSALVSRSGGSENLDPSGKNVFERRLSQSSLDIQLSLEMQQCSATEKVQRWKETMGKMARKAKLVKLDRLGRLKDSSKTSLKYEKGSRDSLDSGLNSLSVADVDAHRGSLNVLNGRIGSVSPLNGEHDTADDTLTSVMSSLASDFEMDVSDIEEPEEHHSEQSLASRADCSHLRGGSASSFSSGADDEGGPHIPKTPDETICFMDTFVDNIFHGYEMISQMDKAKFGAIARTTQGRNAFARALNAKRVGHQRVDEGAFLSLVQSMAVILFECSEAHDWSPAKALMNMCFTFYTDEEHQQREHLYSHLSSQKIWKSLRFWNSAFFEAILAERAKFNLPTTTVEGAIKVPDKESQRQCLENITFSQLATFTHNMNAFGLPLELCLEFLNKQLVIGNLPKAQQDLLQENIERMYSASSRR